MRIRAGAGLLALPLAVLAQDSASVGLKTPPAVDLLQWVTALIAVLAAIGVLAWGLRRLGDFSRLQPGSFRVLAALSLGARERVVLLQAGDKQLVLGVAPGRVQTLCVLERGETIELREGQGAFAARLHEALTRRPP